MKTLKSVVVWTLCVRWGLYLISEIPTFRPIPVDPITGDTLVVVVAAAGSIFRPLMIALTFVVLLWTGLTLSKSSKAATHRQNETSPT